MVTLATAESIISIGVIAGVGYVAYRLLRDPVGVVEDTGQKLWDIGEEIGERLNYGAWVAQTAPGRWWRRRLGYDVDEDLPSDWERIDSHYDAQVWVNESGHFKPGSWATPLGDGPPPEGDWYTPGIVSANDGVTYRIWSPV